jgi:hypothetical protein
MVQITGFLTAAQRDQFFSENLFRFVFGRKPNPKSDRSFLLNYLTTIEKTSPELLETLLEKGISEGQIEAIYQTGITPTEVDFHEYPPLLLQLWLLIANHTAEGSKKKSKVEARLSPRIAKDRYGTALAIIYAEINNTIIRLSHVIDNSFIIAGRDELNDLLFYYLSRTIQIIRSIRVLVNNDEGGIIVSLGRNLFECFVRIKFLNERPDIAKNLILPALVDNETLVFLKNSNGKIERKKVKNTKTGEITRTHYPIREMLRLCSDTAMERLYDVWYPELSNETHITSELLADHLSGPRFSIHREMHDDFAMVNLGFAIALIMKEIGISKSLTKIHARDVQFGCKKICKALRTICTILMPHMRSEDELTYIFTSMEMLTISVLGKTEKRPRSRMKAAAH